MLQTPPARTISPQPQPASPRLLLPRRRFLHTTAALSAAWCVPGAFADMLTPTARQTEGPFYPDRMPLDTDNDLIILNDQLTPAVGTITHLTGRVLTQAGLPMRNATVEIWQADSNGCYIHSRGAGRGSERDGNFQGFGRFLTGSDGRYYFRTIRPTPYVGRTPHIHVAVNRGDERLLTTQCYVEGEQQNAGDGLFNRVPEDLRKTVVVPFVPLPDSPAGELAANFDLIIGTTPEA